MENKYINSIIDSISGYLFDLSTLGVDRKKNLRDIHTLIILWDLYDKCDWYEVSEYDRLKIQRVIDTIILNNSELVLPAVTELQYYMNVNTPQTILTWQRIYDNPDTITINEQ